jgi:hypothetical protein
MRGAGKNINIGDVVKKRWGHDHGPEAYVLVLEKEVMFPWEKGHAETLNDTAFHAYAVLQNDGTITTFTDAVLIKGEGDDIPTIHRMHPAT